MSLLQVNLSIKKWKLNKVYEEYNKLGMDKVYEPIIGDLFKFAVVHKLTTAQIAAIYNTGVRNVQICWRISALTGLLKKLKRLLRK